MSYVDVGALHELFDNFGRNTTDHDALDAAIEEHTYYYINDNLVSMEELYSMFGYSYEGNQSRELNLLNIAETNIHDVIFGWVP